MYVSLTLSGNHASWKTLKPDLLSKHLSLWTLTVFKADYEPFLTLLANVHRSHEVLYCLPESRPWNPPIPPNELIQGWHDDMKVSPMSAARETNATWMMHFCRPISTALVPPIKRKCDLSIDFCSLVKTNPKNVTQKNWQLLLPELCCNK